MTVPGTKTCLVTLVIAALPFVIGNRAMAQEPDLVVITADSPTDNLSSIDTQRSVAITSTASNRTTARLLPTLELPPVEDTELLSEEVSEAFVEESLDDDFLDPGNISPDAGSDADVENDAGEIRPLPKPEQTQRPPQPNGQLLIRSSAFTSSNVTGSELDSDSDLVFVNGATVLLTPKLGADTRLIATAGGGLTRFATEGENNYNSLDFSVGVQHRLSDTTYGQIGWVNNQLYSVATGEHTLSENSARLLVGRQDQLAEQLRLDTSYELRARFSDPGDRSRISNTLATRLRYDFSPDWQGSLGYRLAFSEYTQNGRADTTHQLQAATTYTPTRDTFVSGFASYAFGNSSEAPADLSNLSFGVGVGLNLPLF